MSEALNVLFVGSKAAGRGFKAVAATQGWATYLPTSVNEALGMYVFYAPEVIIIEGDIPIAEQVFEHLAEVTHASPRYIEAMVVLSDGPAWETPEDTLLAQLPCCAEPPEIFATIRNLLAAREQAVYRRQYVEIEA